MPSGKTYFPDKVKVVNCSKISCRVTTLRGLKGGEREMLPFNTPEYTSCPHVIVIYLTNSLLNVLNTSPLC